MKLANEIKAPLDSARAVLARREKILAETEKANADLAAAEAKLQQALEALSTQEAAVALGETSAVVRYCRDDSEAASARIRGLQAALAQNDTEILRANEALAAAFDKFYLATLESYAGELKAAAAAFLPTVRKGIALSRAFERHTSLEELVIPDPRRESEAILPVLNRVHTAAGGWTDDLQPDAAVASVRAAFEELQREARRISTERETAAWARAESEAKARMQEGPQYRAVAVGDYQGAPKHFDPTAERQSRVVAKPN